MAEQDTQDMAYAPFLMFVMICSVDGGAGIRQRSRLQEFLRSIEANEFVTCLDEVGRPLSAIIDTLLSPQIDFGDELVRLKDVIERRYSPDDALTLKLLLVKLAKEIAETDVESFEHVGEKKKQLIGAISKALSVLPKH